MAIVDIRVPQMGEGLTEVRLLEFLKRPGETVTRDEIIYTMETDKATLEVESPEAGLLVEWLAEEGSVLPIGATVARIDSTSREAAHPGAEPAASTPSPARPSPSDRVVPPRTRAYAREHGLFDEIIAQIPSVTAKLMPSDIDAYMSGAETATAPERKQDAAMSLSYLEQPVADRQRKLIFHLKRSSQTVVPGTISRPIAWAALRDYVTKWKKQRTEGRPTEFQTFAYCVVQATTSNPKFRCSLVREDTLRFYERLHLGVAVALPGGDLTTAVVPDADLLPFPEFITLLHERIQAARAGQDQADAGVQLLLSYLGAHGIRDAVPVLVAPAAAVMFLGESYTVEAQLFSNVALTFDHRLMNGVEAAEFLKAVATHVEQLDPAHAGKA